MFWWLAAYGVATVFSALNSVDPTASLVDCKQLVLFLIVPVVYRFARGSRALTFATVIISVGALSALIGIAQFGLLHFDNLGQRPHGSLTHYMTYSGVLMLVACAAAARLVFRREGAHFFGGSRTWTVLVMPALIVALALTFTRSAWVGLVAGVGVLIVLKDRRLLAAIPLVRRAGDPDRADQRHRPDVLDVRRQRPVEQGPRRDAAVRRRDRPRPPAHRRRAGHGEVGLQGIPPAVGGQRSQRPPAQRAGAHRGRARPARPARLDRVHPLPGTRPDPPRHDEPPPVARRRRRSPRWPPCSPPGCSSTTSGTPSS